MKAVIFEQLGRPEDVLTVHDVPAPTPGEGELLVKVAARPIHPADFLFISGQYVVKPIFPQVAGFDGVGEIILCGPGVDELEPGRRVAFRSPGSWAELAVVHASRVYLVPSGVSDALACQFPLNPLTAWGLLAECELPPGSRALITAGRSVIAGILSELARRRGWDASLLVRDDTGYSVYQADGDRLVSAGATVADVLRAATSNRRFHVVLDAVGGPDTLALMEALEPRGRLVSYGVLDDSLITLRASMLLFRNLIWQGFLIDSWLDHASPDELAGMQCELWRFLLEAPHLLPVIGAYPLADIQEAIRIVRETSQPGKVLLIS